MEVVLDECHNGDKPSEMYLCDCVVGVKPMSNV